MRTYILKRILGVVPTVLMITLVVFVMMRSVPGDPVVPLLGVLLLLFFSVGLGGLLPSSGWVYLPGTCPMMVCGVSLWGNLQHVLMPAIALGIGRAALLTRLLRTSMLEVIRTEYVTTARAKGLAERPVVLKHALKNALIPTVTVMGLQVGFLIGGAIVVETLFAMPGLGTFGIDAIIARDYQQVQGFALVTAFAFVVINLIVDLTYTFLDPRIRYASGEHGVQWRVAPDDTAADQRGTYQLARTSGHVAVLDP